MENVSIKGVARIADITTKKIQDNETPVEGFSNALRRAADNVDGLQQGADKAILNVQTGSSGSVHEAMIALEKADLAFRTMLQVRNKLIEAYQEIMRMQV